MITFVDRLNAGTLIGTLENTDWLSTIGFTDVDCGEITKREEYKSDSHNKEWNYPETNIDQNCSGLNEIIDIFNETINKNKQDIFNEIHDSAFKDAEYVSDNNLEEKYLSKYNEKSNKNDKLFDFIKEQLRYDEGIEPSKCKNKTTGGKRKYKSKTYKKRTKNNVTLKK